MYACVCFCESVASYEWKAGEILHSDYWLLLWKKVRDEVKDRVNSIIWDKYGLRVLVCGHAFILDKS